MLLKTNNTILKVLIALLFTYFSLVAFAHREQSYFLQGHLYGKAIGLQIDEFDDVCFAHFFEEDNLFDRVLEGTILGDSVFNFYMYQIDSITNNRIAIAQLEVKQLEEHKWYGTWSQEGKPEQNVVLNPINIDSLQHPYTDVIKRYNMSSYSALRLMQVSFKKGKPKKTKSGIKVQPISDPQSGINLFLLESQRTHGVQTDSINLFLKYQILKEIDAYYNCSTLEGKGIYKTSFKLHFVNPYLLSYAYTIESSCYGGAARINTEQVCLSMENATSIPLEKLIWFSDKPFNNLTEGEYKWFQYRYNIFAPKIYEMLKLLYPNKIASNDECSVDAEEFWQVPKWYISGKGINLQASSNYTTTCKKDWFLIPFKELTPYASKVYGLPKGK